MPPDQFGHVFKKVGRLEVRRGLRVSRRAGGPSRQNVVPAVRRRALRKSASRRRIKSVPAGRYKLTAWIRGLDIGEGVWHNNTEFEFDGKYTSLKKNGTFGWTPLTYVADMKQKKDVDCRSASGRSGYFWIDDVSLVRVGSDVPLTAEPTIGSRKSRSPRRGRWGPTRCVARSAAIKNMADWGTCYACGAELAGASRRARPGHEVARVVRRQKSVQRRNGRGRSCDRRRKRPCVWTRACRVGRRRKIGRATIISRPISITDSAKPHSAAHRDARSEHQRLLDARELRNAACRRAKARSCCRWRSSMSARRRGRGES